MRMGVQWILMFSCVGSLELGVGARVRGAGVNKLLSMLPRRLLVPRHVRGNLPVAPVAYPQVAPAGVHLPDFNKSHLTFSDVVQI
jgi:hypothetical protein